MNKVVEWVAVGLAAAIAAVVGSVGLFIAWFLLVSSLVTGSTLGYRFALWLIGA
jgi:hypothetical protein